MKNFKIPIVIISSLAIALVVTVASFIKTPTNSRLQTAAVIEGFGSTGGGTGKPTVLVTNLNDSGAGSLRAALSAGNRYVLMNRGLNGSIVLNSAISITGNNITLYAQPPCARPPSCPNKVTIEGAGLVIRGDLGANNIIIRKARIRNSKDDGIQIARGAHHIIIDESSITGSADGNIDITEQGTSDITVQWSLLGKNRKNSLVEYGAKKVSYHHNVMAFSEIRSPHISAGLTTTPAPNQDITMDFRNNLIWGWLTRATTVEYGAKANIVNNYYGGSSEPRPLRVCKGVVVAGSVCTSTSNKALAYIAGNYSKEGFNFESEQNSPKQTKPFFAPTVSTQYRGIGACALKNIVGIKPLDTDELSIINNIRC
jgi:pectate lyase